MKRTSRLFMLSRVLIAPLQKQQVWTANIDQIRRVARMIPGRDPLRINVLKFAESRRAKKFSVKGAPDEPSVQPDRLSGGICRRLRHARRGYGPAGPQLFRTRRGGALRSRIGKTSR